MTAKLLIKKLSALVLLALVLGSATGVATIGFLEAKSMESRIEANRLQLAALRRRVAGLVPSRFPDSTPSRAEAALSLLLPATFSGSAAALLQSELIQMVKRAGGRAGIVRVLPSQDDRALTKVSINIALQANIASLRKFLFELETTTPLIFVDQLEISAPRSQEPTKRQAVGDARRMLKINLEVSSFMLRKDG